MHQNILAFFSIQRSHSDFSEFIRKIDGLRDHENVRKGDVAVKLFILSIDLMHDGSTD